MGVRENKFQISQNETLRIKITYFTRVYTIPVKVLRVLKHLF